MTAAAISEVMGEHLWHVPVRVATVMKVTASDWVIFNDCYGVVPLAINNLIGTVDTFTYAVMSVNNTGTAYSATSTSIVYDTAVANARTNGGYYIMTDMGEIIYVVADSGYTTTGGTLTCIRGCLGTTAEATAVANDKVMYVLQTLTLTGAGVGETIITFVDLPKEPKAAIF